MGEYKYEIERLNSRKKPIKVIDIDFLKNKYSRHFFAKHSKKLPNEEKHRRR